LTFEIRAYFDFDVVLRWCDQHYALALHRSQTPRKNGSAEGDFVTDAAAARNGIL
jgi:hypothetical protein